MGERADLARLSVRALLELSNHISDELRARDVLRSANNPTGDYAEYLFCAAFGWTRMEASKAGYDATDEHGRRFQIKGRRLTGSRPSRQMSAIRNLESGPFDHLAGVLFTPSYGVERAALVPISVVRTTARWSAHTRSHLFFLANNAWDEVGVEDVTERLREAECRA